VLKRGRCWSQTAEGGVSGTTLCSCRRECRADWLAILGQGRHTCIESHMRTPHIHTHTHTCIYTNCFVMNHISTIYLYIHIHMHIYVYTYIYIMARADPNAPLDEGTTPLHIAQEWVRLNVCKLATLSPTNMTLRSWACNHTLGAYHAVVRTTHIACYTVVRCLDPPKQSLKRVNHSDGWMHQGSVSTTELVMSHASFWRGLGHGSPVMSQHV
jgi:hypothetical protein